MITIKTRGDFKKTRHFLLKAKKIDIEGILRQYGAKGVQALSDATPVDSGLTAASWYYEIVSDSGYDAIVFKNSNIVNGVSIAIILQYGHGTGTGGYVQGRDYINPAIQPVFDEIAKHAWREVTS